MFILAIIIGIYAYSVFTLGLFYLLNSAIIFIFSALFIFFCLFIYRNKISIKPLLNFKVNLSKFDIIILLLIGIQFLINLVGALSPEIAFDALWYHLTFPKMYLQNHGVIYIPGGLLYYSTIPKLIELIYTAELAVGNEILPKLTQLSFGLLTCVAVYGISKKYLSRTYSLLSVLLFYSNLVIAWESTTAYIDLGRGFFEAMSLWGFINFIENKNKKDLIISAIMLGLAIASKLISVITIPIFIALIFFQKERLKEKIKLSALFSFLALFIVLPWLVFSFVHTGNPVYPLITNYDTHQDISLLNPLNFPKALYFIFTHSSDPLSPFYIIIFPVTVYFLSKIYKSKIKIVFLYSLFSLVIWYFTPHPLTSGGRFIIPFIPALSIISIFSLSLIKNKLLNLFIVLILIFISVISIFYRGIATHKFIPVLLGIEKKEIFLENHLNFSFGDFYDTDNYFKLHIKTSDTVLLYGFHNLYYVDFNFIDSSWVKKGDQFNYIATQNTNIPPRFSFWKPIYYNPKTHVRLYSLDRKVWTY